MLEVKICHVMRQLQWGRVAKDAETRRSRWAMALGRGWLQWGRVAKDAETWVSGTVLRVVYYRFNGAASRRTRKLAGNHSHTIGLDSFNGAASRRTRKPLYFPVPAALTPLPLQWGRVAKDAETRSFSPPSPPCDLCFNGAASRRTRKHWEGPFRCRCGIFASMGPRREGRGNPDDSHTGLLSQTCFNGAASRRTRKPRASPRPVRLNGCASMGPRREGRGNSASCMC